MDFLSFLCLNDLDFSIFKVESLNFTIMDRGRLYKCLKQKTWLWQRIFSHLYLAKFNLSPLDSEMEVEAAELIKLCHNEDDMEVMWNVVDFIDAYFDKVTKLIEDIQYCRPMSRQYDFVARIFKSELNMAVETLNLETVVDAYCVALINDFDMLALENELDAKYAEIFADMARKQNVLKRNLSLILETTYAMRYGENTADMNYRELVDMFVAKCGVEGIVKALKTAQTPETKLTADERECQAFAYYSPFFFSEEDMQKTVPGNNIFACVEDRLQIEHDDLEELQRLMSRQISSGNDDDDNDEVAEVLNLTHNAVYVDPQDRCVIDVRRGNPLYAHVYIEKFPEDKFNNSLPDFIRYHKGWLYTVEFVDDLKKIDELQLLNQRLNASKQGLLKLMKVCKEKPWLIMNGNVQRQMHILQSSLRTCYYISEKM